MWKIDKGSREGTTTQDYADALDWSVAELGSKTILLKNTHASQSLKYQLLGYAVGDGIGKEVVPESVLEAEEIAEFHYERQWDRLVVQVKSGSGAASYRLDYEGQGA